MIKLVILDVDGVLTDGRKTYGTDGVCISKTFCDKDFTAIKKLKSSGVNICFCSGDANINEAIAKNRNIDFYNARHKEKCSFTNEFEKKYNCTSDEMLYIGDDIFYIGLLKKVGFSVCPSDAANEVKKVCDLILQSKGGDHALCELVNFLYKNNFIKNYNYENLKVTDAKEKF